MPLRRSPALPSAARAVVIGFALATALAAALLPDRPARAATLPGEVADALQRAGLPADALSVAVHDATTGRALFSWNADTARNPGSLAKLLTTASALDRLGPAWTWSTPVWLAGPVQDGVLDGSLHIQGSGDPRLVLERIWLLLRRVMLQGVREIRGDIVLDQRAFAPSAADPAAFDGKPLRPYNVQPVALLLNYRSVLYTFVPDAAAGVARVVATPLLARSHVERQVPLAGGPCGDWQAALKAEFTEAAVRFAGSYPASCGEQTWAVADPQPASYDARLLEGLWREMGGQLAGRVREGPAPAEPPSFELRSPPLAEVVRDINKFSNNVMAEQLFLTLAANGAAPGGTTPVPPGSPSSASTSPAVVAPATPQAARAALRRWLAERLADAADEPARERRGRRDDRPADDLGHDVVIDNGSGLSRQGRLTARLLARLLVAQFASPTMPELMSSLPIAAADGTLRRARMPAGRAHLKTGSLDDVAALAGYLLPTDGHRLVLVAIVNHPNAAAARPALDALVQAAIAGGLTARRPARPGTGP